MNNYIKNLILTKLFQNVNFSGNPGYIIASPSNDPPYKFHWIRDSAIVMKSLIDVYLKNKTTQNLMYIINYIESEYKIQNLDTISGLGEPKIRLNGTPFSEAWGRPQNDGPALRGINMIKIYNFLKKNYKSICENIVIKIIEKDINYILENYRNTSFDLWEEINGWHFYTRVVQFKFFKEFLRLNEKFNLIEDNKQIELITNIYNDLKNNLQHHKSNNLIVSSFDQDGNIIRWEDASILLGLCHVDYDEDIINIFGIESFINVSENLISIFKKKYKDSKNLVGRYAGDKYYDGQAWFICSLAICQLYFYLFNIDDTKYYDKFIKSNQIFEYIISIDSRLLLAEQFNPDTNEQMSAKELTWNYTELYFTYIIKKK